ncbi:MAG: RNA ligase family protein [Labilithrix sp.]|nr:RNA ligase family protein [Labilithrix sp.]
MSPPPILKYPRTRHVEGSRLQPGDQDLDAVPWRDVGGRHLVVEEKIDGANAAIRFAPDGTLLLQSRGHYLAGGARERHFSALKPWARAHAERLREVLDDRYVMYGEWVYAKHTVYYDALPHYFLEFDVLDTATGAFLSTPRRRALLAPLPVVSVPVLHEGPLRGLAELLDLVGPSRFKTGAWREHLGEEARSLELDVARVLDETDASNDMEGLYIKIEEGDRVVERLKWVRPDFLTSVVDSGTHWLSRPIVPNGLAGDASLDSLFFAPASDTPEDEPR